MKENWTYKKLGEVCEVTDYVANGSFATLRENVKYQNEKSFAVLVRLADYSNGFDVDKFVYINEHAYEFLAKSKLYGGEIIMSNVGSLGKLFICPNLGMPMSLAPNSIVIRTPNNLFYKYCFSSSSFQDNIKKISSTTALPKFNKTQFKQLEIPVPPLAEQERIVEELDLLSGIIEKQKQQLKELDTLAQSIFYDTFGDPITNEKNWPVKKLKDVCSLITDGDHMPPPKSESGIPFITISNIDKQLYKINFNGSMRVPFDYYDSIKQEKKAMEGDVLYTVTGSYGVPIIVKSQDVPFCFQRHIGLLRPKNTVLSVYLFHWALTKHTKYQADSVATGIAQKTVSLKALREFIIPLPPLSLQQEFAEKIEMIEKQKEAIGKSIKETQLLFDYTMDKYFG